MSSAIIPLCNCTVGKTGTRLSPLCLLTRVNLHGARPTRASARANSIHRAYTHHAPLCGHNHNNNAGDERRTLGARSIDYVRGHALEDDILERLKLWWYCANRIGICRKWVGRASSVYERSFLCTCVYFSLCSVTFMSVGCVECWEGVNVLSYISSFYFINWIGWMVYDKLLPNNTPSLLKTDSFRLALFC